MITERKPISMAEAEQYLKEDESDLIGFIRKFTTISSKDSEEMRKEIEALDNMKLKPEHIVKIIDTLPENSEDLNKIFSDLSLDENEANQIFEIVKKYK